MWTCCLIHAPAPALAPLQSDFLLLVDCDWLRCYGYDVSSRIHVAGSVLRSYLDVIASNQRYAFICAIINGRCPVKVPARVRWQGACLWWFYQEITCAASSSWRASYIIISCLERVENPGERRSDIWTFTLNINLWPLTFDLLFMSVFL